MKTNACDFCVEFSDNSESRMECLYPASLGSRLLFRRGKINVFPCLGSIEFGHILIATTYHCTAFTSIKEDDYGQYTEVVESLTTLMHKELGVKPTFFEHGDPDGVCELQGPCISHAHIHVAPNGGSILERLLSDRPYLGSVPLSRPQITLDEPYLMCTDRKQTAHYFSAQGTPRQYLRQLYSEALANPDGWNWAANIDFNATALEATSLRRMLTESE